MSYQLQVKPLAEEDIRQASDWYELEKARLGDDFIIALDRQFTLLRGQPFLYAVRYRQVRLAPLKNYPYLICYRVQEDTQTIVVEAVRHQKQDPDRWQSRL